MRKLMMMMATMLAFCSAATAAERFVTFVPEADAQRLCTGDISYSENDFEAVKIAIGSLKADMQQSLTESYTAGDGLTLLIGTLGKNADIDRLVKQGQLSDLKGKREKFVITTIGKQLVIAGSDRRGTVYGIYELSEQLGVSPWYWWMDVPVEPHACAYIKKGTYTDGEPAVEFRGLFLNDEAPCLTSWVKNTWGTDYGDHRFYEKVFELILRLRGNMMWPAMWGWAFYADDPENGKTADRMGIIMGTSHHEPMARNHQEYARKRQEWGPWNYATNKANLDRFFREGIERMKGTEDMVTIGMRGDGDEAMSAEADTKLLQSVVENQRRIIKEVTGRPAKETTQVWALYKEVLDYYDAGMRVPDDVIMLLCDDNWGNVRRVPSGNHKGGWGLYYHVDYVGAPRNSKWLNVTPSQNMWEQLTLAYDYGIRRMWILNVGDLKPMEYPITLFMDMAWNPGSVGRDVIATHTTAFCTQQFGPAQGPEAARILNRLCKLNGRCTPEMLDARTYNVETGEWQQVADEYMRLETEALRQYLTLSPQYRDAYQQLILFPTQAMSNLHQMYFAQAMNLKLAAQGSPDANLWADRVAEAFHRDSLLCADYNHGIAGGKWNGMMTQKHIGYRSWNDNFPRDMMPRVQQVSDTTDGGYVFTMKDGTVTMEAEHFFAATPAPETEWTIIPDMGRTRSAVALTPYTKPVEGAELIYRWNGQKLSNVEVSVVTKSTLDFLNKGGLTFTVQLDDSEPVVVNFNENLNEKPENIYSVYYPTVARRVVESKVQMQGAATEGEHTLILRPRDPAIVFEKIVVTTTSLPKTYLFGNESEYKRGEK
ncbi:MAG: glycosyl hydrolase 115 family protein [Prevotella sp.]|nr:glycosyl hydrolase 115 family protein [Prevotella sp.]